MTIGRRPEQIQDHRPRMAKQYKYVQIGVRFREALAGALSETLGDYLPKEELRAQYLYTRSDQDTHIGKRVDTGQRCGAVLTGDLMG